MLPVTKRYVFSQVGFISKYYQITIITTTTKKSQSLAFIVLKKVF